jgi:hypothetical protein
MIRFGIGIEFMFMPPSLRMYQLAHHFGLGVASLTFRLGLDPIMAFETVLHRREIHFSHFAPLLIHSMMTAQAFLRGRRRAQMFLVREYEFLGMPGHAFGIIRVCVAKLAVIGGFLHRMALGADIMAGDILIRR